MWIRCGNGSEYYVGDKTEEEIKGYLRIVYPTGMEFEFFKPVTKRYRDIDPIKWFNRYMFGVFVGSIALYLTIMAGVYYTAF